MTGDGKGGNPFPPTSRYAGVDLAQLPSADGSPPIVYLRRRFLPDAGSFARLQTYTVVSGDRLDNVTATFMTDPEQFWRLCDANNAMSPDELCRTVGRVLDITLPQGVPGPTRA